MAVHNHEEVCNNKAAMGKQNEMVYKDVEIVWGFFCLINSIFSGMCAWYFVQASEKKYPLFTFLKRALNDHYESVINSLPWGLAW